MHPRATWLLILPLIVGPSWADEKPLPKKTTSHKVVKISAPEARQPAEVSVGINPTNPRHIVAASYQGGTRDQPSSNHIYESQDGGVTWKSYPCANPQKRMQGDDVIIFDAAGVCHHAYIAFQGIRTPQPRRAVSGIFLSSLRDGKWADPVAVVDHFNSVEPFEDKPWLVADRSDESPRKGHIYAAWTRFDAYGSKDPIHKSHILFSRSRDGGRNFDPPVRISDKAGSAIDDSTTVEGAVPAVGPKGEIYLCWAGPEGLVFDRSTDGGTTFGKDRIISDLKPGWDFALPGLPRHNGMPITAADISQGKDRGSVYVCWIDKRHGDADVFLLASRNGGETWEKPVRVNDDAVKNGKDQAHTWMFVDAKDGSVNVIFYDRRDLEGTKTGLTLARSVDGGRSFVNHRVAQEPFSCEDRGVFFGDYIGVAAHGGHVVAAYMHFAAPRTLALSAAIFHFKPGSQETEKIDP